MIQSRTRSTTIGSTAWTVLQKGDATKSTFRKVALNWRGMQVAAGILYSQVPSVMRRPVFSSWITSSVVKRPSPWMKAPST